MKKPSPYAIKRAKRTLFGRVLCRLVGEQTGAVMMEYVVIGVLVVAAAVAMVQLFGGGIRTQFKAMIDALFGRTAKVTEDVQSGRTDIADKTVEAEGYGTTVSGQSSGDGESEVVPEG